MKRFKVAALLTVGKFLAVFVFLATSLSSCGAIYFASSAVFYPEQTDFPNGVPPASFLVVIENRGAPQPDEAFAVVTWNRLPTIMTKNPDSVRLSRKEFSSRGGGDPWRFKVIEETASYQVIELRHQNTQGIKTRYRVEGSRVTPLSFKTDGGVALAMLLIPVFILCLWLSLVAARRSTRWVKPAIEALRGGAEDLARGESTLAYRLGKWVGRRLHISGREK